MGGTGSRWSGRGSDTRASTDDTRRAPAQAPDVVEPAADETGVTRSASTAFADDLPGPVEWAYLTSPDSDANSSLFLIQHADDSVPESYLVADTNSSKFVFGGGQLTQTPIRYSLGVVDSVEHAAVSERLQFVVDNTLPP